MGIVGARGADLDPSEVAQLVGRLEDRLTRASQDFRSGSTWIVALFVGLGAWAGARGLWAEAAVSGGAAAAMLVLGIVAARRNMPERMRAVVHAIRDRPELVVSVRHSTTSDSRRIFVTHWIRVRTADRHLLVKANDDWQELLHLLRRRCRTATIDPGSMV